MSWLPWADGGCSGHHYTEAGGSPTDYRIRGGRVTSCYRAEKEVTLRCEHDGCRERITEWRRISARVEPRYSANHDERHYPPRNHGEQPKVRTKAFTDESTAREVLADQILSD